MAKFDPQNELTDEELDIIADNDFDELLPMVLSRIGEHWVADDARGFCGKAGGKDQGRRGTEKLFGASPC